MKKNIKKILYIFSLIIFLSSQVNADDWPRWRGLYGNGISTENGWNPYALNSGAKILWKKNVGKGYSAVSARGGHLYTMGNKRNRDIIFCLDSETGKVIWHFDYKCEGGNFPGPRATPILDENRLYTLSREGQLFCLNSETGKVNWQVDIAETFGAVKPVHGFSGSPVIEDSLLILNACRFGLALDKRSGQKIWSSEKGRGGYSTPVIYEYQGIKYVAIFADQSINGVNVETGEKVWSFPWEFYDGACIVDPVVDRHQVFISSGYRKGAALIDFTDNQPKQIWFRHDLQNEFGSNIYLDGYLYAPIGDTRHEKAYLKCVKMSTGEIAWSRDIGHNSLICVDSKLIVLNQWGELFIMKASKDGYHDLSTAKIMKTSGSVRCWTAPVFSNGRIYVRNTIGDVVCVDVKN